jgi:hypothetical protein
MVLVYRSFFNQNLTFLIIIDQFSVKKSVLLIFVITEGFSSIFECLVSNRTSEFGVT